MNVAVLRSIKPYWVYLICEGKKTIEVGKNIPRSDHWNKRTYIYCSKDLKSFNRIPKEYREKYRQFLGKIIGVFVCDYIEDFKEFEYDIDVLHRHIKLNACINYDEINDYLGFKKCGYGWHISNLTVYTSPKELNVFNRTRPPQTWCYVPNGFHLFKNCFSKEVSYYDLSCLRRQNKGN